MNDLFGNQSPQPIKTGRIGKPKTNPLIRVYGPGPDGAKCRDCQFQFFREFAKKYSKCEKREVSSSPKTDHNSRYQACGLFRPKPTGRVVFRYRCRVCGGIRGSVETAQEHHDERMRGFGWENPEPGVWIRPEQACSGPCNKIFHDRLKAARKRK